MRDSIKAVAILVIIIALLGGAFFLINRLNQIPENPANAVGNTPGNLYNGGLFCVADDGTIFFSNPYEGGALCSMRPDGSELKVLRQYSSKYINSAGDYLYFYQESATADGLAGFSGNLMGIYRLKKNADKATCLDKTLSGVVSLAGNKLFYQHYTNQNKEGMTLYSIGIDKKDKQQVIADIVDPSCVVNGTIYYAGPGGDQRLFSLDTRTGSAIDIFGGPVYNPIVLGDGNTLIYINVHDNYSLHGHDLASGQDVKLTDDRVDCFNITNSYIYYQKNDPENPALMRMSFDGGNKELIAEGNFTHINVAAGYVYYQPFGADDVMFRTPGDAPVAVQDFRGVIY